MKSEKKEQQQVEHSEFWMTEEVRRQAKKIERGHGVFFINDIFAFISFRGGIDGAAYT